MLTEILLIISILSLLYLLYTYAVTRPEGYPPGPPRLPLFGSYLFMMLSNFKYMHKAVLNFSKWYKSDIVGFHFGVFPVVTVHSPQGIKEILNNKKFDGRPQIFLGQMRDPRSEITGIFFMEGNVWHEQRRFVLRYLRDFGFGRRFDELELIIKEELTDLLDLIRNGPRFEHEKQLVKSEGYRILLPCALNPFAANSFFHILQKERIPRSEQAELIKLIHYGMTFQRTADDYGKMLSILPWIRHIFPNWSSYNKLMECNKFIYQFFENLVDHHIETFDENFERNFLDLYIEEMKNQNTNSTALPSTFNREQFIMALIDFSFPAFTAIGTQIALLIQYLILHPEVCKRMQREIDDVVGTGRLPSLDDRINLSYTEATIREGLRIATLVPSDIPHKALVDTELMGYKIPRDTVVVPSLYAYHMDKRLWDDPENFCPERFLANDGKLCLRKDVSLPFGAGKRLCAGETFARNMLFLMTATLVQNFNFVLAPADQMPDPSKNLSGLIISPPDFWLQLEERITTNS